MIKRIFIYTILLILLFSLGIERVNSQINPKDEKGPEIKLGEIRFQVREMGSLPSQIRLLEIQMEIINRSRTASAPKNSIKVLVTPKEIKFPQGAPTNELSLTPEEITLNQPLAPSTGRVLVIGYSLLEAKPEFITFEIQLNPPDGEKKMATWEGR